MLQSRQWKTIALTSAGFALCVGIGSSLGLAYQRGGLGVERWLNGLFARPWTQQRPADEDSAVLTLALQDAATREADLQAIANQKSPSIERSRARYLLANDAIAALDGGKAIRLLEGLEQDYPLLAPYIQLKRARAYELTNRLDRAQAELEALLENYPDSPVRGDALVALDAFDAPYGDRAITEHPDHPRTHTLVRQRLKANPDQLPYLLVLAHHTPDAPGMSDIRDRLVADYADQLTPEDWQAIADGYWEQWEYGKAASAYRKAPRTPTHLYRIGRGLDLSKDNTEAKLAYENFLGAFPSSEEAGLGLLHLARLTSGQAALPLLDRAITSKTEQAPKALLRKAKLLKEIGRRQAASKAHQQLLDTFPNSDAAADYRWQQAKRYAKQEDYLLAWKWAHPIATKSPDSSLAPKAAYWVGKWAANLNRLEDARAAYQYILRNHPESYYAWRAASQLGLDVGTFTTVETRSPELNIPQQRPFPPAGSDAFRELYQLGQDIDARALWFLEQAQTDEPTVNEQFTTALVQATQGDYLESINSIWNLTQRKDPADRAAWQALRTTPDYWYALFPFPYAEAVQSWSAERQVNPLLVIALMRQESRFQPDIRSSAGALGLMQVMPDTGEEVAEKVGLEEYSLINPEDNIALGTWYLNFTHREFDGNSMLAIASYNAGPGNVSSWLKRFSLADPDEFVEQIPFGETKGYVESVFGNYWNYLRLYSPDVAPLIEAAAQ
ncbi:MAG: transglycosylase SLT domain-containing protein [Spirulina sp. SIO3F2]|nr:transglycosylase SLT domain-containing protein [Spirulina sp. SIO3F2]